MMVSEMRDAVLMMAMMMDGREKKGRVLIRTRGVRVLAVRVFHLSWPQAWHDACGFTRCTPTV